MPALFVNKKEVLKEREENTTNKNNKPENYRIFGRGQNNEMKGSKVLYDL